MSARNSKTSQPSAADEQLRVFMEKVTAEGRAAEVMAVIQQSFTDAPEVPDQQAMSDASKRRREDPTSWDDAVVIPKAAPASFCPQQAAPNIIPSEAPPARAPMTQGPVMPQGYVVQRAPAIVNEHLIEFPPGIRSIDEWGRTVCTLPKVASRKMTYRELANEGHMCQEMRNYLTRFIMKNNGTSAKVNDFKRYLYAIDYLQEVPGNYAPAPMTVRTIRE